MAAYAALLSLMNTVDQILNHSRLSISFDEKQIKSLLQKIEFLQDFMDKHSHGASREESELLEARIASAAHAAEDAIETHVADQIDAGSDVNCFPFLLDEGVIEEIDAIKENVMKVKDDGRFKDLQPFSMPAASSKSLTIEKSTVVGFEDYLLHLEDTLTRLEFDSRVVPIVGMGGIGKTTLARNVFESSLIMQFFDIRAWVTVSQNYSVRELLLELLSSVAGNRENFVSMEEHQLGVQLHKRLWGRRYLIILDDIWDVKAWETMEVFFPKKEIGSRIVVTTRLKEVGLHFSSSYVAINFLGRDQSWELLCRKAFGQEECPVELEKAGKKIAENCKGLPLSIVVIGGFLRKSNRTQEFWGGVARDTNSILKEGEEQCLDILFLSYIHLPAHLKPCFLYMGVFPEDEEIRVSRLIKLWVAEGFLKPNESQSLEEVGQGYIKDLVDRNLILLRNWGSNGNIKACNVHDLLRELCLKVAEKEKFLCAMKLVDLSQGINKERRIVIHERASDHKVLPMRSTQHVRSLICKGHWRGRFTFRLLRVLNVVDEGFVESDSFCVNLRCIDRRYVWFVEDQITSSGWHLPPLFEPRKISLLWNLQSIIIKGCLKLQFASSEIWDMPQLRHLKVDTIQISDPPPTDRVDRVLQNLQTLSAAENFKLSEEVCKRIPNIKRLSINYGNFQKEGKASSYYCPHNLGQLEKLRSLNLCFGEVTFWRELLLNMTFPDSLQKLTLYQSCLHWEDLSIIGSLPRLEVLKLEFNSVVGTEWNPIDGEFGCLKFLKVSGCFDLTEWNADSTHFPAVENLVLEYLSKLEEIPIDIGEIPTLRFIRLDSCHLSCAISAVEILRAQESCGNEDIQLEVQFNLPEKMESFKEKVKQEGFTSNNLHLKYIVS